MARAAHAYSYPQRERVADYPERPRVRAFPGAGRRPSVETLPAIAIPAAVAVAVVLVLITLIGFARIALNTATVTTAMATQDVNSELSSVRYDATLLEVQQSTLSNLSRIKEEATELGMAAAESTETITLSQDVVATSESGELELAESIRLASQATS